MGIELVYTQVVELLSAHFVFGHSLLVANSSTPQPNTIATACEPRLFPIHGADASKNATARAAAKRAAADGLGRGERIAASINNNTNSNIFQAGNYNEGNYNDDDTYNTTYNEGNYNEVNYNGDYDDPHWGWQES
mmetsp:Transcript_26826/g.47690  ORF Transcript_26826/g.47690 Transcript_26826/m.47690 type:complete len:135 (-) Transcript_26826:376-780(-)